MFIDVLKNSSYPYGTKQIVGRKIVQLFPEVIFPAMITIIKGNISFLVQFWNKVERSFYLKVAKKFSP